MDALHIPPHFLGQFVALRKIGPQKLAEFALHLREFKPMPLNRAQLAGELATLVGDDASPISEQIIALNRVKRDQGITAAALVEGITRGLERVPHEQRWSDKDFVEWRAIAKPLADLFSTDAIDIASKVAELTFEYANLLTNAIVVTDIRPIYDDRGETIKAAVISQTLRIYFTSEDGDHSLSIAMDKRDLERLRDRCAKAIKKADSAHHLMKAANVPVSISGDQNAD